MSKKQVKEKMSKDGNGFPIIPSPGPITPPPGGLTGQDGLGINKAAEMKPGMSLNKLRSIKKEETDEHGIKWMTPEEHSAQKEHTAHPMPKFMDPAEYAAQRAANLPKPGKKEMQVKEDVKKDEMPKPTAESHGVKSMPKPKASDYNEPQLKPGMSLNKLREIKKAGKLQDHPLLPEMVSEEKTHNPASPHIRGVNRGHAGDHVNEAYWNGRNAGVNPKKELSAAKEHHKEVLNEMRSMPKPNLPKNEDGVKKALGMKAPSASLPKAPGAPKLSAPKVAAPKVSAPKVAAPKMAAPKAPGAPVMKSGMSYNELKKTNPANLTSNAEHEQISQGLKDANPSVRYGAMKHPKATAEHISQGLKDKYPSVRHAAMEHPQATAEHISQGLKDEDWGFRYRAMKHPNANTEHISQGLKDEDDRIRMAAIIHPNATSEHISQGLKDKSPGVRYWAMKHPNATAEHISQGLKDEDPFVRRVAAKHPNASSTKKSELEPGMSYNQLHSLEKAAPPAPQAPVAPGAPAWAPVAPLVPGSPLQALPPLKLPQKIKARYSLKQKKAIGKEAMRKTDGELEKAKMDEGKTPREKSVARSARNERTKFESTTETSVTKPGLIGTMMGAKPKIQSSTSTGLADDKHFANHTVPAAKYRLQAVAHADSPNRSGSFKDGNTTTSYTKKQKIIGTPAATTPREMVSSREQRMRGKIAALKDQAVQKDDNDVEKGFHTGTIPQVKRARFSLKPKKGIAKAELGQKEEEFDKPAQESKDLEQAVRRDQKNVALDASADKKEAAIFESYALEPGMSLGKFFQMAKAEELKKPKKE